MQKFVAVVPARNKSLTLIMNKAKFSPGLVVAIIFGALAVFGGARAYQSYVNAPKIVVEGNQIYNEAPENRYDAVTPADETLGSVASPVIPSTYLCVNNVCTYNLVGTFTGATASTTLVSFINPFQVPTSTSGDIIVRTDDGGQGWTGASSTVDLARIQMSGASASTFQANCGPATTQYALPSMNLLTATITTSSVGMVENNLTAANGGLADGGTVAKVSIGPSKPYFNCVASGIGNSTLFVSSTGNSSMVGKVTIRVQRTQGS